VNESTLQTAEGAANADGTYLWSRAYDASAKPSAGHIDAPADKPIALASVVMTNSTTTKLYFLLVQCSATCFESNYKQIAAVTGSFTIGGGS
jgi:hypothetical protein